VPPATLLRYIRGGKTGMPVEIFVALQEAGYDTLDLEEAQMIWAGKK
jgi:hypothetical protein